MSLKTTLDGKIYRQGSRAVNQTFYRLRLLVLIALTTGMRIAEIFGLKWSDIRYREEVIAVSSRLKGGKNRYVPLTAELASELERYPAVIGEERIFPPKRGAKGERRRVEGSFETILEIAGIAEFRFHDLRHTFASWFMMNGGDHYELAKILGHSNVKMTERYAKLARNHIARGRAATHTGAIGNETRYWLTRTENGSPTLRTEKTSSSAGSALLRFR